MTRFSACLETGAHVFKSVTAIEAADKRGYQVYFFFLFLHEYMCCGYSLEAPCRGASKVQPHHVFV